MKTLRGVEVKLHCFVTSALGGGQWSASRSDRIIPGEEPAVYFG